MNARFSRRTVLVILGILVLLCVAFRYPLVEHERFQTDSYFVHYLGQSIVDHGMAKWTFSPLSYFGLYPLSYPSGYPFILAEVSELTGLSVEVTILLSGTMFSVLFCLVGFCLAREFLTRPEYALLVAVFVILGPRFVDTTYWDASSRGPAVVMIALLILISFRLGFTSQRGFWPFILLIGFACVSFHRMSVLLLLFALAYVMTIPCYRLLRGSYSDRMRRAAVASLLAVGGALLLATLTFFELLEFTLETSFGESGLFAIENSTLSVVVNAGVSFTHQIGFIIVPAAFGLVLVFRKHHISTKALFPVTVILAFLPMIGNALYVSMLLLPFVSILGVDWLASMLRRTRHRRVVMASFAVLIVGSFVLTGWSVDRWNGWPTGEHETVEVDSQLFSDSNYLIFNGAGYPAIASRENLLLQFLATTHTRFLKSGIVSAIDGEVNATDMEANVRPSTTDYPNKLYTWLEYNLTEYYFIHAFIFELMYRGWDFPGNFPSATDKPIDFAESHSHLLVVVDNRYPGYFSDAFNEYRSLLLAELSSTSYAMPAYILYRSETVSVYFMELNYK